MKSVLIIQGPLYKKCIDNIITMCRDFPSIISTWDNEDQTSIDTLKLYALDVILNKQPEYNGIQNINYVTCSIKSGLAHAEMLGYTHALRFRTDIFCPTIKEFISIFENESVDKLVGLCWFNHYAASIGHPHGYIMDHVIFAPIDKLTMYYSPIQDKDDKRHSETFFQDSYFKKSPVAYEDVKHFFCFVLNKLIDCNMRMYYTCKTTGSEHDMLKSYNNIIDRCIGRTTN